jgi:hypothetical protein
MVCLVKDRYDEPEGGEWEPIKILLEGDRGSKKMNSTSNTRLRLNYPSWSRPRSPWSATDPRNQQTTFRAKTHQHAQRKLAQLAACATPVRPMACAVRPVTPVRPVERAGQAGGCSNRTTNAPESLSDFSRPWNKDTPKTQPARKENPTQNLARQHQTDQELTSNSPTQRHRNLAAHPRQIPQRAHTGETAQEHWSDRCNLGSSG